MNLLPHVYLAYALAVVGLTIWLARVLAKNGAVFLADVFPESPEFAAAVNSLLVVGFYLVNLGYGLMMLRGGEGASLQLAIETLSSKVGALLISLAIMHFLNLLLFHRIRRRARRNLAQPPVLPNASYYAPSPVAIPAAAV